MPDGATRRDVLGQRLKADFAAKPLSQKHTRQV
jgi:hypothetical protein